MLFAFITDPSCRSDTLPYVEAVADKNINAKQANNAMIIEKKPKIGIYNSLRGDDTLEDGTMSEHRNDPETAITVIPWSVAKTESELTNC